MDKVKRVVKSQISRHLENRVIGYAVETNVQHNSAVGPADPQPLIPQITKGDESFNREGDRLKPKSLTVKGLISIAPGDLTNVQQKDLYVRVMILSQKNLKTGAAVLAGGVDTAHLLRPNYPLLPQTNYGGNSLDVITPINRDLYRVYMDKTFKLSQVVDGSLDEVTRFSRTWSYSFKKLPASCTFDQGNGDWINNFAPFLAIGYAYSDGTAPDVVTTRVISQCFSQFTFEDA